MTRKDELSEVMMTGLVEFRALYDAIDKERAGIQHNRRELRNMFITGFLYGAEYIARGEVKKSLRRMERTIKELQELTK